MDKEQKGKGLKLAAAVFGLLLTIVASTGMHAAFAWEKEKCPPGWDNPGHEDNDVGMNHDEHPGHEGDDCR